jgi:heme-degrading monooxygenase HmoA
MAIVRIQDTPTQDGSTRLYDQVTEKMNVEGDPPAGMIVHTASVTDDGRILIVDVWESQEAFDRFEEERLMPALREAMGGDPPEGAANASTHEAHNVVVP